MGKLTYLRPRRGDVHPVLMLLTSHRLDCFLVCIRCLERFTDLGRFKHIYVVGNALGAEHLALAKGFVARHANASLIERGPRGIAPAVLAAQNEILSDHLGDVVIRMDEDMFVTPQWFDDLLDGYLDHADRADVPLVMPLVPISAPGRQALGRFLRLSCPSERHMYSGPTVEEDWVYHRWMWEKIANENLMDVYLRTMPKKYAYVRDLSLNCVVLDKRILHLVLPFSTDATAHAPAADAASVNAALQEHGLKAAVLTRTIVHHYSFSQCEGYLRSHLPLEKVWRHMRGVHAAPPPGLRCRPGVPGHPELTLLRAGG